MRQSLLVFSDPFARRTKVVGMNDPRFIRGLAGNRAHPAPRPAPSMPG